MRNVSEDHCTHCMAGNIIVFTHTNMHIHIYMVDQKTESNVMFGSFIKIMTNVCKATIYYGPELSIISLHFTS